MNTTTAYRITKVSIDQAHGMSRDVWFLDAIRHDQFGTFEDNIMSGSEDDCRREMDARQNGATK